MDNKYLKYDSIIRELELMLPNENKIKYSINNIMRVLLLAKFVKTIRAIKLLDENRYYEDANILIRTLFEILITVLYCEIKPNDYYERYDKYSCISKLRYFSTIKEYNHPIDEKNLQKLKEKQKVFFEKYKINNSNNKRTWNNLSFYATVKEVEKVYGKDIMLIYDCIYCLISEYIHTSSQCLQKSYFKIENNKYCYNSDPIIQKDENIINYVDIISKKIIDIYSKINYL